MRLVFSQAPITNQRLQQELRQELIKKYELVEDIFRNTHEDNYKVLIPELSQVFLEENFEFDKEVIEKGLEFMLKSHLGQYRDSGLPFSVHPVHTGLTLAMWGRPQREVLGGLGHDSVDENEENKNLIYERIQSLFGENVRRDIEAVTTLEEDREIRDKKSIRKLLRTVKETGDISPLFIYSADKLTNLYSGKDMKPKNGFTAKQRQQNYANGIINNVLPIARYLDRQELTDFKIASGMNYFAKKLIN